MNTMAAASLSAALPVARAAEKKDDRPNILLLFSEDISPNLSCYGTPVVQTPVLDKMAADGIRFTNAFVTGPVCSASRSAIATGMCQTSIGAHNHRASKKQPLPEPVKTFMQQLKEAGYYATIQSKTDFNFLWDRKAALSGAGDWHGRAEGQPFFCQVNFGVTHRGFRRDPERPIDPKTVALPPVYPDHPIVRRDWADYLESIQVMDRQAGAVLKRLDDEGIAGNTLVIFLGDHGQCLPRGKQFCYDDGLRVPLLVRWPKGVKAGQVRDELVSSIDITATILECAGVGTPAWMQGRPFLPEDKTLRQFIFAARDRCDGTVDRIRCVRSKDFMYIKNFYPDRPYTQLNAYKERQYPGLAVMKLLYKQGKLTPGQAQFMAATRPAEELYDVKADPYELHNLAGDPKYAGAMKEFRDQLDNWIETTGDKGSTPEDPGEIRRLHEKMVKQHEDFLKKIGVKESDLEGMVAYWEKRMEKVPTYSPEKDEGGLTKKARDKKKKKEKK